MSTALEWFKSSYSGDEGGACLEVAYDWRKSSYSGSEGGACLEVAPHPTSATPRTPRAPPSPSPPPPGRPSPPSRPAADRTGRRSGGLEQAAKLSDVGTHVPFGGQFDGDLRCPLIRLPTGAAEAVRQ